MRTLNIGILAHIDAGKTSLTERLLFHSGAIDRLGSVHQGSTQTDTLDLERERGITIQSAVASFTVKDLRVNLIDTPGHSDFIAEVERALRVLDGAILVISAVEGVQSQTRTLMRTLRRLKIPTLFFINKVDQRGARERGCYEAIAPNALPLCTVQALGNSTVKILSLDVNRIEAIECLAENDDALLASYLENPASLSKENCLRALQEQTRNAVVYPLFLGSAITGAGISELLEGITTLLPSTERSDGPLNAIVFKIERGSSKEKLAYVRLYSGTLHSRDPLVFYRLQSSGQWSEYKGKATSLHILNQGAWMPAHTVSAGDIVKIGGLKEIQIGDSIGTPNTCNASYFPLPTLETVVTPNNPAEAPALYHALKTLAEEDPLIKTRRVSQFQEITVCLYGEVQKEFIQAQLQTKFGIPVQFEKSKTVCIERPLKTGEALHAINWHGENAFYATVGLRIEPSLPGSGIAYQLNVEQGALPRAYHSVLKESVLKSLDKGLYGWEVTDCIITLTHAEICPLTLAGDFRKLGSLLIRRALESAGTEVCEPYCHFELEIPEETLPAAIAKLIQANASIQDTSVASGTALLKGIIRTDSLHAFEQKIPSLTSGNGIFVSRFAGFQPMR